MSHPKTRANTHHPEPVTPHHAAAVFEFGDDSPLNAPNRRLRDNRFPATEVKRGQVKIEASDSIEDQLEDLLCEDLLRDSVPPRRANPAHFALMCSSTQLDIKPPRPTMQSVRTRAGSPLPDDPNGDDHDYDDNDCREPPPAAAAAVQANPGVKIEKAKVGVPMLFPVCDKFRWNCKECPCPMCQLSKNFWQTMQLQGLDELEVVNDGLLEKTPASVLLKLIGRAQKLERRWHDLATELQRHNPFKPLVASLQKALDDDAPSLENEHLPRGWSDRYFIERGRVRHTSGKKFLQSQVQRAVFARSMEEITEFRSMLDKWEAEWAQNNVRHNLDLEK